MTQKIFFFHNPKAGGSAIGQAIEVHFPELTKSPVIENDSVDHQSHNGNYQRFQGFDFYSGHYGRDIYSAVDEGHIRITNFRHPIGRLVSLYNFFRYSVQLSPEQLATERYYAVNFAKEVSFHDFISNDDPRICVYTRNQHARQLLASPWVYQSISDIGPAYRFVDSMSCYYICEYPELSLLWMRESLGLNAISKRNITTADTKLSIPEIGAAALKAVLDNNHLDVLIYNYAVNRFTARFETRQAIAQQPKQHFMRRLFDRV